MMKSLQRLGRLRTLLGQSRKRMIGKRLTQAVLETLEERRLLAALVDYVVHVSVDGLRPDAIADATSTYLPNFYRLRTESAYTLNARTDYDETETLQNHICQVTARPVWDNDPKGHHWDEPNAYDPASSITIHTNYPNQYVASVFDVAHEGGKSTCLYAGKTKLELFRTSYDNIDPTGQNPDMQMGRIDPSDPTSNLKRNKVDYTLSQEYGWRNDSWAILEGANGWLTKMKGGTPFQYSFLHFRDPDKAGHEGTATPTGWGGADYRTALRQVDSYLGSIFDLIDHDGRFSGRSAVVLTADHGGGDNTGVTKNHGTPSYAYNYTIPLFVWSPFSLKGGDLYGMNVNEATGAMTRQDPSSDRVPNDAAIQPIHHGDSVNLELQLLGLGGIEGSYWNASQDLNFGALFINGTDVVDTIDVALSGSNLVVTKNGIMSSYPLADYASISVNSKGGNDTVTISSSITLPALIDGGAGDDKLTGGGGNDTFIGGSGSDVITGNGGIDTVDYSANTSGQAVNVSLAGGTASDGQSGTDTLVGIRNVRGGAGNDTLTGDANDNVLRGNAGNDTLTGGGGIDTADYTTNTVGVNANVATGTASDGTYTDTLVGIRNLWGGGKDDILTGDGNDNTLRGNGGSDLLVGGGHTTGDTADYSTSAFKVDASLTTNKANPDGIGYVRFAKDDSTNPYWGTDTFSDIERIVGGSGDDSLTGGESADSLYGGDGNDVLVGKAGADLLNGGDGNDTADYFSHGVANRVNADLSTGTAFDQTSTDTLVLIENLYGGTGNDALTGNSGANILRGNAGNDTLTGGGGIDTADYSNNGNGQGVNANLLTNSVTDGLSGTDTLSAIRNVWGGAGTDTSGRDTLTGDGNDNLFRGNAGNDSITGGGGIDTADYSNNAWNQGVNIVLGTSASDGLGGSDTLVSIRNVNGGYGRDTLIGDGNANFLNGNTNCDSITGNAGADSIIGGWGNDTMRGEGGNDTIDGGMDNDTGDYSNAVGSVNICLQSGVAYDGLGGTDSIVNTENLIGGLFDDNFCGNTVSNNFVGGAGDDQFFGCMGNDTLIGGSGRDWLWGDDGNDLLVGNTGDDFMYGGADTDTVDYSSSTGAINVNTGGGSDGMSGNDYMLDVEIIIGSPYNDTIAGEAYPNGLYGGNGNDSITGMDGNDTLDGGDGADTLTGMDGNDTLNGGPGNDRLEGGSGSDEFWFSGELIGQDTIVEASNVPVDQDWIDFTKFTGSTTAVGVRISLALQSAQTVGTNGANTIAIINPNSIENGRATTLYDDMFTGDDRANILIAFSPATTLIGGDGNDTLIGWATGDSLDGGAGNDSLSGGAGSDTLVGGSGNDTIDGGAGNDLVDYSTSTAAVNISLLSGSGTDGMGGTDSISNVENLTGSAYNDTLIGNSGANVIRGGAGNDSLSGGGGDDYMYGGYGDDYLNGEAGNDYVSGEDGNDTLVGGTGSDGLYGGYGSDWADYSASTGAVSISLQSGSGTDGMSGTDTLSGVENLTGSPYNDTLVGDAYANTIRGGAGNDYIYGGYGDDYLYGEDGNDCVSGDDGNDRLFGDAGNDSLYGGNGADYMYGGSGNDYLNGGSGSDYMNGETGADSFYAYDGYYDYVDAGIDNDVDSILGSDYLDVFYNFP